MVKWIYSFGDGRAQGSAHMAELLGSKGANLAEMTCLGLPVPPGFTITTQLCRWFYQHDRTFPSVLEKQLHDALDKVEHLTGRRFGGKARPLLLSVRSGAQNSMPGMMDTVLNVGLNDETVKALATQGGACFAYDTYRRFIQMYSTLVLDMEHEVFEDILDEVRSTPGYGTGAEMTAAGWQEVVCRYKDYVAEELGQPFPQPPQEQFWGALGAVLASWMSPRAVFYRDLHDLSEEEGTAVTVQAMVFGNMGADSATGVAFTRNPSTGENGLYGEFLINAQGEEVVSGIHTPQPVREETRLAAGETRPSLETAMPAVFAALQDIATRLEQHYHAVQDIEFTIEQGRLWLLQTRKTSCTALAVLNSAVDMARSGLIGREEAILRVEPAVVQRLLCLVVDPAAKRAKIARGLPASPGVATGAVVFSSAAAQAAAAQGQDVILVRHETNPRDIHGMHAACGILTTRGGVSSHAASVAQGMSKPCVCGAGAIHIAADEASMTVDGQVFLQGEKITVDGNSGEVFAGEAALIQPVLPEDFAVFMQWVDDVYSTLEHVGRDAGSAPVQRLVAVQTWLKQQQERSNV